LDLNAAKKEKIPFLLSSFTVVFLLNSAFLLVREIPKRAVVANKADDTTNLFLKGILLVKAAREIFFLFSKNKVNSTNNSNPPISNGKG